MRVEYRNAIQQYVCQLAAVLGHRGHDAIISASERNRFPGCRHAGMDARERYEHCKEALRVEGMRRGLGQSTDAEVNGRRDDFATATNDLLRGW